MDLKKIFKGLPDWNKIINDNFDLIAKLLGQDTGWIKAAFVGDSAIYYRRIGNMVYLNGLGNKSLPKNAEALLWAIPSGFIPSYPAARAEGFHELSNTDSTPTNVTIIRIRSNMMHMIYRNNDNGCSFDGVCWPTADPFPA